MSLLQSKRQLNKANTLTAIIIVTIIALVVNIFSSQLFTRFDVTANKDYSISDTSKDILRNLPDVVNVKAYFTSNLPGYLVNTNRDVRDLLSEIETNARGNVIVTYLDPNQDEKIEQEARGLGIPTLQFNVVAKDQYQVTNGYLGIAVFFGDNKEIIPLVRDTSSLEYDIAAAISKVTRQDVPKIAFLKGHKAFTRDADLSQVGQLLEKQYDVRDWDVTSGDLMPEDITTLIIPGVREQLTKREQYAIDQFLMRGGSILVLQEGADINPSDLSVNKLNTGIDELLAQWGVRLNKNLVLDVSSEMAGFRTDTVQFFAPYPLWMKITKGGFNPESGIVNKLESLVMTWASSLEVLKEKLTDKTQAIDLARTTAQSWAQDDSFELNPQRIEAPKKEDRKSFVVATMLSGEFRSMFSKDSIPEPHPSPLLSKGEGKTEKAKVSDEEKNEFSGSTDKGRVIVVGDADFPVNDNVNRFKANAVFFQNLVDALASDEKLIAIRSKAVTDRPIKEVSDRVKNTIKWLNILGVSVLFTGYGLIRFARRKKARVEI
ncbi:MAG: hypothetical protein A3H70_03445 [Candidatus Komeilibacteria bacterium RIFCSPLOWO2_02_FULL_48_11]|uniref:Uncharacterized protein n=1 Tax=Candidatus Komeilibacteria bacterium RIFCSPLOWO2_02_FULL_48_11 TaxID=1798553 RepID=A0A1G2BUK9_9BACT|nr:MAG: hypothetical protein A3H70_03445 [Candidatus Komeilibacteria bacterium RIFCSPLOWO2_02_FULL_48_11]